MQKKLGIILASVVLCAAIPPTGRFAKYKTVEAYEVRPGLIVMPSYSNDGQICEIGLEKRHYSPEGVDLYSSMSIEQIQEVFDELIPGEERGPKSKNFLGDSITMSSQNVLRNINYENITIQIYSLDISKSATSKKRNIQSNIVATAEWKDRKCQ